MAGTITVTGAVMGLEGGEDVFGPMSAIGTLTEVPRDTVNLSSGDNAVAVPTGAVMVLLVFASTVSGTVKLRTNLDASDAGVPLTPVPQALFAAIPLPSGVTSLILNGSGSLSGTVEVAFI